MVRVVRGAQQCKKEDVPQWIKDNIASDSVAVGLISEASVGSTSLMSRLAGCEPGFFEVADRTGVTVTPNLAIQEAHNKKLLWLDLPGFGAIRPNQDAMHLAEKVIRSLHICIMIVSSAPDEGFRRVVEKINTAYFRRNPSRVIIAMSKCDTLSAATIFAREEEIRKRLPPFLKKAKIFHVSAAAYDPLLSPDELVEAHKVDQKFEGQFNALLEEVLGQAQRTTPGAWTVKTLIHDLMDAVLRQGKSVLFHFGRKFIIVPVLRILPRMSRSSRLNY